MANILIVYANDQKDLTMLEKEAKEINRLLDRVPNKKYTIKILPAISSQELIDELAHNGTELEILHYSGHADSKELFFAGKEAKAEHLALKLSECPNLKLVFLNGCNTEEQVPFFHQANIPFVIATNAKVRDDVSYWMASQFYFYLTLGRDVSSAFSSVKKDALLEEKEIYLEKYRGIGLTNTKNDTDDLEWNLYEKEEAKNYHLPLNKIQIQNYEKVEHGKFLREILIGLKDYESPLSSTYKETIDTIEISGDAETNTKLNDLLKILPYPIGIRLRQISAQAITEDNEEDYYRELLSDYACFFETLLQYSFSLLVSQIWQKNSQLNPDENIEDLNNIKKLICSNLFTIPLNDYIPNIKSALHVLQTSSINNPIPKIKDHLDYFEGEEFEEVCRFFDMHRSYYWRKIKLTSEEAIQYCYQAQNYLIKVFPKFGFVIENVLASIRNINVINFRHVEEAYANEIWQLLASEDGTVRQRRHSKPMENKSVLCFSEKEYNADTTSLNLFPFFIDRSAFAKQSGKVVDLYQFAGYFHDDWINNISEDKISTPCFHFMSLRNPGRIWRFNDQDVANVSLFHIDEKVNEGKKSAHMLAVAGELNSYFREFKSFLNL